MATFHPRRVGIFELVGVVKLGGRYYYETVCKCGQKTTQDATSVHKLKYCGRKCSMKPKSDAQKAQALRMSVTTFRRRMKNDIPLRQPLRGKQLYNGKTITEWSRELGISLSAFKGRLYKLGPDNPEVYRKGRRLKLYRGKPARYWATKLGISQCTFTNRIKKYGVDSPIPYKKERVTTLFRRKTAEWWANRLGITLGGFHQRVAAWGPDHPNTYKKRRTPSEHIETRRLVILSMFDDEGTNYDEALNSECGRSVSL